MTTVTVTASRSYDVEIGSGLLQALGARAAGLVNGRHGVIVTDTNVAPLYLAKAEKSLKNGGFTVSTFVFPAGEASKNGKTWLELLEFLAAEHLTRGDLLVALGGGVVGDLTGFAAASFLRGIAWLQLPTTLLAAVDASVGGKTAIDLQNGKNLAGAFYQPTGVLCDTDTLATLPDEIFADGCAEVIKYGLLNSKPLLEKLAAENFRAAPEEIIAACVAMKRDAVIEDEYDTGTRRMLNLGHTVGHAIEVCSGYGISHGKAVAMGMMVIARAAVKKNLCLPEVPEKLSALLERYHLPCRTEYTVPQLYEKALSDKKRLGDTLTLVIPTEWGASRLHNVPVEELPDWIAKGLES